VFIIAAFAGTTAMRPDSVLFVGLQLIGCTYLIYLGILFIRHAGTNDLGNTSRQISAEDQPPQRASAWRRATGMGFLSGILNPKNALFYASLAAMLTGPHASPGWKTAYGTWMFSVVLLWDGVVAVMIGNQAVLRRFARALPWLERISGAVLILLAVGVLVVLGIRHI
jgi:threonine/homoserine/homoserine lactone efflux protein